MLRIGPGMRAVAPDPRGTGGQYLLVLNGDVLSDIDRESAQVRGRVWLFHPSVSPTGQVMTASGRPEPGTIRSSPVWTIGACTTVACG